MEPWSGGLLPLTQEDGGGTEVCAPKCQATLPCWS